MIRFYKGGPISGTQRNGNNHRDYCSHGHRPKLKFGVVLGAILAIFIVAAPAGAILSGFNEDVEDALQGDWGKINLNIRWRFEYVDQENKGIAKGDPIRVRLGYLTPKFSGFQLFGEFEGNTPVFFDEYNSTRNGKTQYPIIADPAVAELNQGWLSYSGIPDTTIKAGRQRIIYDNHRFIGNVGWRQLEKTYDSAAIVNRSIGNTDFRFAFIGNVRNVTGRNVKMTSPILNLGYTFPEIGRLTAYGYWLDYTDAKDSGPFPFAFSTQTYGIRFNGSMPVQDNLNAFYTGEYAYQADFKKNPRSYHTNYFHLIGGVKIPDAGAGFSDITGKLGWEHLGSSKGVGLQTPLGTNHAFQGWADQFVVTPPTGVVDLYGALGAKFYSVEMLAVYHQFDAAEGGADYGQEIDAFISKKFGKHYTILAAYAQYFANEYKTDTKKIWIQAVINF